VSKNKSSIENIQVVEDVISPCQKAISEVIGNNALNFQTSKIGRNKIRGTLNGEGSSNATIGGRPYNVLPLVGINKELFWFSIVLLFGFTEGIQYLESVSIVVVKGLAYEDKTPILRAEWDCGVEYLAAVHAQPHWHIYPSAILNRNLEFDDVLDTVTDPELNIDDLPNNPKLPKFHFAMATSWHKGSQTAHANLEEISGLTNWISSCISYTRQQLLYCWE
jgi:hypothetical protein